MPPAIRIENLSKAYHLGEIGTGTISRDLERWWAKARGKEDPFLRIGEANDRETKGKSGVVWSLKELNFEINQGDAVGIIGRNGAGKSTLLKILSRVTAPTTGSVKVKGRIASLLEVGTGFHPELTGRENIYLNGAILGMRKKEIARKFDEIVDFSGVERYIDTPVKRYSSGMYVRLAFAVAAHLESEILIVDEVLAVGDAEFQKKCLGKMGEVSTGEGRTVLFVSHNMGAVASLCNSVIILQNGMLTDQGPTDRTISKYIQYGSNNTKFITDVNPFKNIQFTSIEIHTNQPSDSLIVDITIFSQISKLCSIDIRINDYLNNPVGFGSIGSLDLTQLIPIIPAENKLKIKVDISNLAIGIYTANIDVTNPDIEFFDRVHDKLQFEIIKGTGEIGKRLLVQSWNYGSFQLSVSLI